LSTNQEGDAYCRVALVGEETGYSVYTEVADLIEHRMCDLSVFRFKSNGIPLIAVVGDGPANDLDEQIRGFLIQEEY
jgi:hypothetical protein